ncbi:hypothetical protein ACFLQO_00755 [Candidatus Aenigmatarchaeota archaeon]
MKRKTDIRQYKNFWVIWLTCAGNSDKGISLFEIQNKWGITTNYLYHHEMGLKKPLYINMIKEGFIKKEGRKLKPEFGWIPEYMKDRYLIEGTGNQWYPVALLNVKWSMIQRFIKDNSKVIFNLDNLRVLYKDDRELVGRYGYHVFSDIFLMVLFSNMILFSRKYKADVVMRIISTIVSIFSDRDLLNYIRKISLEIGKNMPVIINNEDELNRLMYPFKW